MNFDELNKQLKEERQILEMHKQNLDAFIEQGYKGFASEDVLREMLIKNESILDKHNLEFNRLISEVNASGRKIAEINIQL